MNLSKYTLKNIDPVIVQIPGEKLLSLPEKVLQFGTGVLLRGLPGYFIDKANKAGIFNGRIVVVKSTSQGDTNAFKKQDCLYTQCIRGIENSKKIEENIINASISRVLSANDEWQQVLECAHDLNIQVIISNTTEVGIQLINDDIRKHPPVSYPGKLLAFLYQRFLAFNGSNQSGMVIVPTELIVNNGKKLESIIFELAHLNGLEAKFIDWLESCNSFCNSLVDRIVPGKPDSEALAELENKLGYTDQLLIMSEVYRLWAIEGDAKVKEVLSFAAADKGVIIADDIGIYRELKLRLLNATHTLSCGPAFLADCETVKEAMDDELLSAYISGVMINEIAPAIPYDIDEPVAHAFAMAVLERFRNPFIRHPWISITVQYSSKIKMRCIPVLVKHYSRFDHVPEFISLGLAAYLFFMKSESPEQGKYYGVLNGKKYPVTDDMAESLHRRWKSMDTASLVQDVLADKNLWGENLALLPGFYESVLENLNFISGSGMRPAIEAAKSRKTVTTT